MHSFSLNKNKTFESNKCFVLIDTHTHTHTERERERERGARERHKRRFNLRYEWRKDTKPSRRNNSNH